MWRPLGHPCWHRRNRESSRMARLHVRILVEGLGLGQLRVAMPPPSLFQRALSYYHARSAWLGEGGQPVSFALSYSRAVTCSTCPLNVQRPLYEALAEPVAALLRRQIEVKAKLQLVTPLDDQLHICNACGC